MDESSSEQQFRSIRHDYLCELWSHTPSANGSYSGTDEILVASYILKSLQIVSLGFSWSLIKIQHYYSFTNAFQSGFWVKLTVKYVFEVHKITEAIRIFHSDPYY